MFQVLRVLRLCFKCYACYACVSLLCVSRIALFVSSIKLFVSSVTLLFQIQLMQSYGTTVEPWLARLSVAWSPHTVGCGETELGS